MTYKDPFGKEHRYGPPAGWVSPTSETFNVEVEWAAILARGIQFPEQKGHVLLRGVRGDCLEPLITDQHVMKIRPVGRDEPLVSGRLYSILWTNETEAQTYRDKTGIASKEPIVICKYLFFTAFEWWCVCKDSMAKLGDSIVVGEVVGVVATAAVLMAGCAPDAVHTRMPHARLPCNNPFDAGSEVCAQLGLNAATTLVEASAAGVGVGTSNVGATYVIVSVTVGPYPYATSVVVTATGTWTADPTHPTSAVNFSIATAINSLPNNIQVQPIVANQQGVIAAEQTFSLAANTTQTYYLNGVSDPPSAPLAAYSASATIKAETIKR